MLKVFVIIVCFLALIILGSVIFFALSGHINNGSSQPPLFSPSPQSTAAAIPIASFAPTASVNPYSPGTIRTDSQRLASPQPLSSSDQDAKNKLTAGLDGNDNSLNQTSDYSIIYVNPPNEFMVEIDTNNADQGKQEAESWLKQQGFSASGICNIPVNIYLSTSVRDYYEQNNLQFNPIPDGC